MHERGGNGQGCGAGSARWGTAAPAGVALTARRSRGILQVVGYRAASRVLRSMVVLASVFILVDHECTTPGRDEHGTLVPAGSSGSVAAPGDSARHEACEALRGGLGFCADPVAAEASGLAVRAVPPAPVEKPSARAPVPRPPRFLLHAALLN